MGKADYANIFVYRIGDLAAELKFAKERLGYVLVLSWVLRAGSDAAAAEVGRRLSLRPPIRRALQR
jgi:hypothetical protein